MGTDWWISTTSTLKIRKVQSVCTAGEHKNFFMAIISFKLSEGFVGFLKMYFIDYAITVVPFSPFIPLCPVPLLPPAFLHFSSCPWVIHVSSLASSFPTLFLPSPCLFSTYHLCYLFSVPSPSAPPRTPLLTTLHVISISMILSLF